MRAARLLGLLVLALAVISTGAILIGRTGFVETVFALDTNTHIEKRPGQLVYTDWGPYDVWKSDKREYDQNLSAETQLISTDVDMDGCDELIFGTYNHSLIVLDVPSGIELMNKSFDTGEGSLQYVVIGNLDTDPGKEILYFDGFKLYCIDFTTAKVQWYSDIRPAHGGWRGQGPITLLDPNDDGIDDILVRTIDRYYRLDGAGTVIHNTSLDVFDYPPWPEEYLGWASRMLVDDLDGDGVQEVFISDWGWSMIPEIYNKGRHVWVIDLTTGAIEFSKDFNMTIFMSDPLLFSFNGKKYIAIGLEGWSLYRWQLLVIDIKARSWEMFDVCATANETVSWLSLIPSEEDSILLLDGIAWSFRDKKILWRTTGGGDLMESPMIICDIDDDGQHEALIPVGPVNVVNATTGELKKLLQREYNGRDLIFYNGERTTVGDFDGDGWTEICQGLFFLSDGTYRITYIDTDLVNYDVETSVETLPKTLYSGIDNELSILIRNMTERRLPARIGLTISNEASGDFARFELDPVNWYFETITYSLLALTDYTHEYTAEGMALHLSFKPAWTFSFEGTNDLTVSFVTDRGADLHMTLTDIFVVERDLVLVGDIQVWGPLSAITAGEWMLPSTSLRLLGFDVVYQGTEAIRPPREAFVLEMFDGTTWTNTSFGEGQSLTMALTSPVLDGEFRILVRPYQPPARKYGLGSFELALNVDGTDPYTIDHFPRSSSWSCDQWVTFALLMGDDGCGVDPLSVEFCLLRDLNSTDSVWQAVRPEERSETEDGLVAQVGMTFAEGSTYVLWRFSDNLGHRSTFTHVVNVDLQGIVFRDFSPVGWVTSTEVNVSARVADQGGSGVNESSLEWSFSHGTVFEFSDWMTIAGTNNTKGIITKALYKGVEGTTNLVRFKGRDMAGNERTSGVYTISIDTIAPRVVLLEPDNSSPLDPSTKRVRVSVGDDGSGVSEELELTMVDIVTGTSWTPASSVLETTTARIVYDITWDRVTSYCLNIEVECWDRAGNRNVTVIVLVLDRPPVITAIRPEEGATFEVNATVEFSISYEEPDGGNVTIEWWLGGVLLSREASFNDSSLPVGNHRIWVVLWDAFHEVTGFVNITVKAAPVEPEEPEPEEPDGPSVVEADSDGSNPWWLVLVVAIIITGSIVAHQGLKGGKS